MSKYIDSARQEQLRTCILEESDIRGNDIRISIPTDEFQSDLSELVDTYRRSWYYVDGVRYCSLCRTRRCKRQVGGTIDCNIVKVDTKSAYPYGLDALDPPDVVDDAEPLFTLRGQDLLAPEIVREWAFRTLMLGSPVDKVDGARRIADAMENWQFANKKRKIAD